jgi:hypothetical protein
MHNRSKGVAELPLIIGGEIILRRNETLKSGILRCLKDSFNVFNGLVLRDGVADEIPRVALLAQGLILWIGEYNCGVFPVVIHGPLP